MKENNIVDISGKCLVANIDWSKCEMTKKDLMLMLGDIRLAKEIVSISPTVPVAEHRRGIYINVKDPDDNTTGIIYVDLNSRAPVWNDFVDVVYEKGKNVDIRIILYGVEHESQRTMGCVEDHNLISNLVNMVNDCGVPTYFVKVYGLPLLEKNAFRFEIEEAPSHNSTLEAVSQLPSKRDIMEFEFWYVYYLGHCECGYVPVRPHEAHGWRKNDVIYDGVYTERPWDNEGFSLNLVSESDPDLLRWIMKNKKDEIREEFPKYKLRLIKKNGKPYKISMRGSKIPIMELLKMDREDKIDYGQLVYDLEQPFADLMSSLVAEYKGLQKKKAA